MRFDIITIFPRIFDSYLSESMIKRARARGLIDIHVHDLRKFSTDRHRKVDDRPYGGGPGMVLKIEPIVRAVESILKIHSTSKILNAKCRFHRTSSTKSGQIQKSKFPKSKTNIILFSAAGKQFDAEMAADFAKTYDRIVMIAGHYEGVDERVKRVISDFVRLPVGQGFRISEVSIGPYVLTGGELPALVLIDAVSRHIPGFLGKRESLEEKRHGVGVPVYTRPEVFRLGKKTYRVSPVLVSGDHRKIEEWRAKKRRVR